MMYYTHTSYIYSTYIIIILSDIYLYIHIFRSSKQSGVTAPDELCTVPMTLTRFWSPTRPCGSLVRMKFRSVKVIVSSSGWASAHILRCGSGRNEDHDIKYEIMKYIYIIHGVYHEFMRLFGWFDHFRVLICYQWPPLQVKFLLGSRRFQNLRSFYARLRV